MIQNKDFVIILFTLPFTTYAFAEHSQTQKQNKVDDRAGSAKQLTSPFQKSTKKVKIKKESSEKRIEKHYESEESTVKGNIQNNPNRSNY